MIAIIDYGAGNLKSVEKAFAHLGYETIITDKREEILSASHVILPGVGSFGEAMRKLDAANLRTTIHDAIKSGVPFMGICLGLHLLFDESDESPEADGLHVFPGRVVKIPDTGLKIPHMGWNSVTLDKSCPIFKGIDDGAYVYFVHSYYPEPKDSAIVSVRTEYGAELKVGIWKDNVFALQFHPEKSSDVGLTILKNFAQLKKGEF